MSSFDNDIKVVPVILCGGSGTRLWPESRENNPKQFLKLLGERSLLQDTITRAIEISGSSIENLITVTLADLKGRVLEQIAELYPDSKISSHVLCEPSARDTAAAVAFAAQYVKDVFGSNVVMWILPADHYIGDLESMKTALKYALKASSEGYLVTYGIQPTRPETGYGYIKKGANIYENEVYATDSFVEKPDRETAQSYLDSGDYFWNSGMFLFSVDTVLEEFKTHSKNVHSVVVKAMADSTDPASPNSKIYAEIQKQPFDKAIMEKSTKVAVVPCEPKWSDIGSWESLWEIQNKDENGNVTKGRVVYHSTKNCLVQSKKQLIACAGLENIVVIETEDAILIADKNNSDVMKALVNFLKSDGYPEVQEQKSQDLLQSG